MDAFKKPPQSGFFASVVNARPSWYKYLFAICFEETPPGLLFILEKE